ncbi:hypothetical protein EGH21_21595 [Halomicroarcula sp. F13]|uniref:Uncharacterized protein n=1 Tax=Haloarcula rubra TaxID=2487747 RepID=A0AAW4PYP9_9EURY|nr:hypothetical protein [Halomicroarcula rubra]MBX0325620.1 hypothetical protein [Halomicroarcula rubra]
MTGDEEPAQQCTLSEPVDLHAALETAAIEYPDVDANRAVVIYQHAILMVTATEGLATETREFDVELWQASPTEPDRDPDSLLAAFIDELLTTTETTRR